MSMTDLEKALAIIVSQDDADFDGPKEKSLVDSAEAALGLTFPSTYKTFLLNLGCGDIAGFEVYGVINSDYENSGIPDAIWLTLKERSDSGLSEDLILIGTRGDGAYYAIDMAQIKSDGEAPVIYWVAGAQNDRMQQVIASDFGSFLKQELEQAI